MLSKTNVQKVSAVKVQLFYVTIYQPRWGW